MHHGMIASLTALVQCEAIYRPVIPLATLQMHIKGVEAAPMTCLPGR